MAISRSHNTLVVGRTVYHDDDEERRPFTLVDVVFDERVGRWEALLESEANGHFAQAPITKLSTQRKRDSS